MDHMNLFSASTKDMESRTKFNNVNFSSFRGSRGKNFNFDGYQSRDANCNMFNQRNMFEYMNGYNGFTGQAPNSFMGADRDFTYARGRSSIRPTGGTAPAKQTANGGDNCGGKCGQYHGISCNRLKGCICSSTLNGTCVSVNSKQGQIALARQKKMGTSNFTGAKRVFPEGRGNYFSGRDMSNGGFRLR